MSGSSDLCGSGCDAIHGSSGSWPPPAALPCSVQSRGSSPCSRGRRLARPCFLAIPPLPWHLPQVAGTLSGYTADRASDLGKYRVRISVTTRAGMILPRRVHAAFEPCGLVGVAALAFDFRDVVRMRILLDVGVAVHCTQGCRECWRRTSLHRRRCCVPLNPAWSCRCDRPGNRSVPEGWPVRQAPASGRKWRWRGLNGPS